MIKNMCVGPMRLESIFGILEFKLKNAKDTFKPHRSNTHILDYDSDSSDDDSKEVYAAEFVQFRLSTRFSSVSQADSKESARGAEIYI